MASKIKKEKSEQQLAKEQAEKEEHEKLERAKKQASDITAETGIGSQVMVLDE